MVTLNDAEMTKEIPSEMEIVSPSDDTSEISDLVAHETDEFNHNDDQPDEDDNKTVADVKDECDDNDDQHNGADINPVADEKGEFDHNDYQHDEMSLNPIEDDDILEKMSDIQNRGCCDMAVDTSIKKMEIPEEIIESLLCKVDKQLCTCETTAFMEKATGINICVADGESIAVEDDEKSNLEISLVENEIVADDTRTVPSTDLDTSEKTDVIAVGTVNTASVANDEKSTAASVEAPPEVPESVMKKEEDKDDHAGVECTLASNLLFRKKVKDDAIEFRPKRISKWSRLLSKMSSKTARSSKLSPYSKQTEEEDGVVGNAEMKLESPNVIEISV